MRVKLAVLIVLAACFSVFAFAQDESYSEKMYFGEEVELDGYIIELDVERGDDVLKVGRWTGTSFLIMEEVENEDLYDGEGDLIEVSDDLSIELGTHGWDEDGRFLEMEIYSDEDVFSSGEMDSNAPSTVIVSQGDEESLNLNIENTGHLDQTYDLYVDTNATLDASFGFQGFNVSEVFIESGEQESIDVDLEVPETAELGTYDVDIVAENGTRLVENMQMEIRGAEIEREIGLDLNENFAAAQPDGTVEVSATVTSGSGMTPGYVGDGATTGVSLENIELDVETPEDWDYDLSPEGFPELGSRDRQQSVLTVEVPADVTPGDYFVEITASSEEASLESPEELRINIREESGMGGVGLLLMAISFGALIFVYRKFSRR